MQNNYILAGATGLVGAEILKQLVASDGAADIFSLGRRPPAEQAKQIRFIAYDFESSIAWEKLKPKNAVAICTLGTTIKIAGSQAAFRKIDFDYVVRFAEETLKTGIKSFHLVTAHGASVSSAIFYNRVKGELEQRLQSLGLPELHIYRPSLLIGNRKEHRPGEGVATFAAKLLSPVFKLPGLNAVQPTPADKLAAFILEKVASGTPGNHVHSNYEIMQS